jgi:hypothetical protein
MRISGQFVILSLLFLPLTGCFWGLSDFHAPMTGGYSLWRTSGLEIDITPDAGWGDGDPIIPTMVIECNHDSRFIIAKRQGIKGQFPDDEPDPSVIDFWILDTKIPEVYGPLTSDKFLEKRIQLGVSHGLELMDIKSFRASKQGNTERDN